MRTDSSSDRLGAGALIVGASQAGAQLASSLRELGFSDPITLVGAEAHAPYQRPPLSKAGLVGDITPDGLAFRSLEFYRENEIDLVTGERIASVQVDPHGSGTAAASSGRQFRFNQLALTVGARARRLAIPGADLKGILYLRDADDASALKRHLVNARRTLIIGGGFIGLEVAASARTLGCEVTVALADERLLARTVGEKTSDFFLRAHTSRGVEVHTGVQLKRFLADDQQRVRGAELADGQVLAGDLVVVGIGAEPRTELAKALGLDVENGIVVNEFAVTSDGRTVAAGDCANFPNPKADLGPARVRYESVNGAVEQAKIAASTIAGIRTSLTSVPWFWSDQFDLKLQVAGLSWGHTSAVLRGEPSAEKFTVLYYRGTQLIAADCINRPGDFVAVRSALSAGKSIPITSATDTSVPLKSLIDQDPESVTRRERDAVSR